MTGVVRSVAVRFSADVAALVAGYRTVAAESEKLSAKQQTAVRGVGTAAGAVAVAAAAALGGTVMAAANFDAAMSNVQAATHESAAGMGELRDAALQAGADTVFSASEAAAGIENLAKAGVSTADILGGGLSGALDLAAAGQIQVAQAAEFTATALTQFQLAGDQATHVADLLAAGAGKAQGEVTDMATALNYAGVPAANLGVTIEETAGTIALLAKNGIIGEQAGTSLRGMISSLASPSALAAKEMEGLGISVFDAQGNFVGLDGVAGQLQKRLGGLTQEERANALGRIFGNAQLQAANVLYREGAEGVRQWTAAVDDQGYAAETAAIKLDNLKGDVEALMGSLETAAIGTGDSSQGALREWVQGLTDVVNAYNKLPDAAKGGVASLLGITAVTGSAVWFGSKAILGVAKMSENLSQLDGTAAKAAGSLRSVGVAAGAAMVLETVVGAIADLNRELDRAAPNVYVLQQLLGDLPSGGDVQPLVTDLGDLQGAISALGDPNLVQSALGGITDFYNKIPGGSLVSNLLEINPVSGDQLRKMREAEASLSALDQALVGLAESDGPKAAREAFAELASTYRLTAAEQDRLVSLLPNAGPLLEAAGQGARNAGAGLETLLDPLRVTEDQLVQTTNAAEEFKVSLEALNGLLDKRAALRNYQAALDEFRDGFKAAKGFDIDLEGGRQNQQLLDNIAESAGVMASHLKGIARTEFIGNVISQLRTMAKNMDLPKGAVDDLIRGLRNLGNTKAEPKVEPQGIPETKRGLDEVHHGFDVVDHLAGGPTLTVKDHASGPISWVAQALHNLDGDRADTYVVTHYSKAYGGLAGGGGHEADPEGLATGGPFVAGRAYWVGEEGPELAVFGEAGRIIPNRESMRIAAAPAPALTTRPTRSLHGGGFGGGPVVVSSPQVRVFIDGEEVRAVVDARVSDHRAHDAWSRPSYQGVDVD